MFVKRYVVHLSLVNKYGGDSNGLAVGISYFLFDYMSVRSNIMPSKKTLTGVTS